MTGAHRCLVTLLITLLPINIDIQIVMLIIILRPIPINYYLTTIVSITIISDQLHSIYDFAYFTSTRKQDHYIFVDGWQ